MTYIDVRYSKDGGNNWSDWRKLPLGAVGAYQQRVVARRFGSSRRWVFEFRVTDPASVELIAASIEAEAVK